MFQEIRNEYLPAAVQRYPWAISAFWMCSGVGLVEFPSLRNIQSSWLRALKSYFQGRGRCPSISQSLAIRVVFACLVTRAAAASMILKFLWLLRVILRLLVSVGARADLLLIFAFWIHG